MPWEISLNIIVVRFIKEGFIRSRMNDDASDGGAPRRISN
jgi:hypothetical protein